MSHLSVVPTTRPRRSPSWLEFIGFSLLFVLVGGVIEAIAGSLLGAGWVDWILARLAWGVLYFWLWQRMGW